MAMTPDDDRKAAAWVHAAAPDDDYLPEPDRGSSDREVLARLSPEVPALAEWTASLNPEARRSNRGRAKAKRTPVKTKAVRRRDGGVGKVSVPLTLEEYNAQVGTVGTVSPPGGEQKEEPPTIDLVPIGDAPRLPLPRRGGWNGPPIEVNSRDAIGGSEWTSARRDRIYDQWDPFDDDDVAEMDRNYDEPDEYDEYSGPDGDDIPNWYDETVREIGHTYDARQEVWRRDHPGVEPADVGEAAAQETAEREREMVRRRQRDLRRDPGLANQDRAEDIEARMIAEQWRAEAQPETCGNPNGCDGPIKAKGRCSPCHEWRRTHHGDERPAAKVNRVRRRKGN